MIRREARLRREYLYKKSQEEREKSTHEKKTRLLESFNQRERIPTELREEATSLLKDLPYDEHLQSKPPSSHADDEYSNAGFTDPKVVITTSRDPSSKLLQFSKEIKLLFPNSQRINRGNYVIKDIVATCKNNGITDLVILHEHRGVPDGFIISHFPHGPTAYFSIHNVLLRHDMPEVGTVSETYPHLIFHNFISPLGIRTKNILRYLFPVAKEDSKRIMTFSNDSDFISFRHHIYRTVAASGNKIELAEMGPRFEMKLYQIKLGTVDVEEADTEWVLHSFMNTSKKRDFL